MNNTIKNMILPGGRMISPTLILTCGGVEEAWLMANLLESRELWVDVPALSLGIRKSPIESAKTLRERWLVKTETTFSSLTSSLTSLRAMVLRANLAFSLKWHSDYDLQEAFFTPLDYLVWLRDNLEPDNLNPFLKEVDKVVILGDSDLEVEVKVEVKPEVKKKTSNQKRVRTPASNSLLSSTVVDETKGGMTKVLEAFTDLSGIPLPSGTTKKAKGQTGALWYNVVREWLVLTNDPDYTIALLTRAITQMRTNKLTIYSPASVNKVLVSLYGEEQSSGKGVLKVW